MNVAPGGGLEAMHQQPTAALVSRKQLRMALVAYGLLIALVAGWHFSHVVPDAATLMNSRAEGISASIAELDRGGPPLLGATAQSTLGNGFEGQNAFSYYRIPVGEPAGLYLYLPVIGHVAGVDSPTLLLKWFFIVCFASVFVTLPVVFFELLESAVAGLVAPLLVLWKFAFVENSDIYWISAWVVLLCLPLVMLIYKHWGRRSVAYLAAVMVPASFATSIRYYAGLPILLAGLLVILLRVPRWRSRLLAAAAIAVAYIAITPIAITAVSAYRDHSLPGPTAPPLQFTPWHSYYIGLGYLKNPYGITYEDTVALEAAKRVNPNVVYLGKGYAAALRHAYFQILERDPGFIVANFASKTRATFHDAVTHFGLGLILVPLMLVFGRGMRERRRYVLLAAPAFAFTLLPPITVIPFDSYESGWLGTWGVLWLLGVSWLASFAPAALRLLDPGVAENARRRIGAINLRSLHVRRPWLIAAVASAAVLAIAYAPETSRATDQREATFYRLNASPFVQETGEAVDTWSFHAGVPAAWSKEVGVEVAPTAGAAGVKTTQGHYAYQLISPKLKLTPGTYTTLTDSTITDGGLEIGVLDVKRNAWLTTANYWDGQKTKRGSFMGATFTVDNPTEIEIILANFRQSDGQSSWLLRRVALTRVR